MKYRVLRDNYGFMGRYWESGKIVEIPETLKAPRHFEAVVPRAEVVKPIAEVPVKTEPPVQAAAPQAPQPSKKKK